jgi:CRISPR/Cas system-associated protein Csm6
MDGMRRNSSTRTTTRTTTTLGATSRSWSGVTQLALAVPLLVARQTQTGQDVSIAVSLDYLPYSAFVC